MLSKKKDATHYKCIVDDCGNVDFFTALLITETDAEYQQRVTRIQLLLLKENLNRVEKEYLKLKEEYENMGNK